MPATACESYKEMQINTADKGKLLLIVYDGAISSVKEAIRLIESPPMNFEKISKSIQKAVDFITELMSSLNMEMGEISQNLFNLYSFMVRHLIEGDIKKDTKNLKDVLRMLITLNEAWEDVILKQKQENAIQEGITKTTGQSKNLNSGEGNNFSFEV
ncbi:flagellar export chaperone FliS [Candidatus Poribacteria bacterium]|nr:flagellar export chaperone FliS [Candidatus Poribacteria bacterium]